MQRSLFDCGDVGRAMNRNLLLLQFLSVGTIFFVGDMGICIEGGEEETCCMQRRRMMMGGRSIIAIFLAASPGEGVETRQFCVVILV